MKLLARLGGYATVAALVTAGSILAASALAQRASGPPQVAGPTSPSTPPVATASPVATAVATTGPLLPVHLYFARSGAPPADANVLVAGVPADRAEGRILQRLNALRNNVRATDVPPGATNPLSLVQGRSELTTNGTTHIAFGLSARVDGSAATVEFDIGSWGVADLESARALVQQLVYTITDEPGVQRARVIEKGKDHALILAGGTGAGYSWKDALSREDVFGYAHLGLTRPFQAAGEQGAALKLSSSYSIDSLAPGLLRFVIEVQGLPRQHYPDFSVSSYGNGTQMPNAKAELEITVPGGEDVSTVAKAVDRTPLRSIAVGSPVTFKARTYRLGLDDQRPWRAVVLFDPTRIVIDVGGPPQGISDDDATVVYAPVANAEVGRTFRLSGVVRSFEASVLWRVRDTRGVELVRGVGKASIGSSPVWGGFDIDVPLPAGAAGAITLEVFQGSPKDGAEVSLVKIPLRVRP